MTLAARSPPKARMTQSHSVTPGAGHLVGHLVHVFPVAVNGQDLGPLAGQAQGQLFPETAQAQHGVAFHDAILL